MMENQQNSSGPAGKALNIIRTGFEDFSAAFATLTQRAGQRFASRDWPGMRRDTVERLDLFSKIVDETAKMLLRDLGRNARRPGLWATIKRDYSLTCRDRCDFDIACTFFNSIHRKVFAATGIDPELTFVAPVAPLPATRRDKPELFFDITADSPTPEVIAALLSKYPFHTAFKNLAEDARLSAIRIGEWLGQYDGSSDGLRIQMLNTPFFRGMSAYLVGRI